MSIDEIKKKSKISLDEMHDNQVVGKPEDQKTGHPINHESVNKEEKPIEQKTSQHFIPSSSQPPFQVAEKYNCKVTFNMPERLFDAFNEIYALRIIQKRKTDKSTLFCEAIERFVNEEKGS